MTGRALRFATLLLMQGWVYAQALPSESIYNLHASLTDQSGQPLGIDVYRGHSVLITMFYSSCPAVCPLLIDTVRSVESALKTEKKSKLRVLLISIDPERDTEAALAELARVRSVDLTRWTLARTDATTVRKIAAVLNIQYRKLPNGDFNHSSIITLLTPNGEIVQQTSMLGSADPELLKAMAQR